MKKKKKKLLKDNHPKITFYASHKVIKALMRSWDGNVLVL